MTTNTPTAGTGNTQTNSSGKKSAGSQFTDKAQTPGEAAVGNALVTVDTQYFEPEKCDVVEKHDADGRQLIEFNQWGASDHAPVTSVVFTAAEARALAAELLRAAEGADEENTGQGDDDAPAKPLDLDAWVPGADVDMDEVVGMELDDIRDTPGYDYEYRVVDTYDWEPGEDVDNDAMVREELQAYRIITGDTVDLIDWVPGQDVAVDERVRDEAGAFQRTFGLRGVHLDHWVPGADAAADNAVGDEIAWNRQKRRRNIKDAS